jgi:hypothetical protein
MNPNIFADYLQRLQSNSRLMQGVMWNHWRWLCAPCRLGLELMDSFLVASRRSLPAVRAQTPTADADQPLEPRPTTRPPDLEQVALKRLASGLAPPREIYDVRNRDRIDWSTVPDWAKAVDPELFEGAHEG